MNTNDIVSPPCCQKHKFKQIFNFISAVFIPILLAVFTVILTLQQESIAKANRDVDLRIAAEQQQQNLELAIDEQSNAQLVAYIHEISDLLLVNNFSLNKKILTSIVRPKTLSALRQLDVTRKGYLLRFLHESRLINVSNPPFLSLQDAEFNYIHIGLLKGSIDMRRISFSGGYFDNSSFTSISFGYSDFSYSSLCGASFDFVSFDYVKFNNALLKEADFNVSPVYKADFTGANMINAKISQQQISIAGSISGAILPDGSIGQNPNLLIDSNWQKLINGNGIQQNVSISQYRRWMTDVGRKGGTSYLFTGWFDKSSDLRANFTEFDQKGAVVQKYCFGNNDVVTPLNKTQLCIAAPWTSSPDSLSNDTNQYKYVIQRMNGHRETYMINVDIPVEQYETCRDVHFSFETLY